MKLGELFSIIDKKSKKDNERPIYWYSPYDYPCTFFTLNPSYASQLLALKFIDQKDYPIPQNYSGPTYVLNDNGIALYNMLKDNYHKFPDKAREEIGTTKTCLAELEQLILAW